MRAVVVAGTHSGCGKTTVTLGIMCALSKLGYKVQPFKTGPDFIDTGLHRLATGTPSRNLDIWMCGEDYVRDCFYKYAKNADLAVIEGVMGMFDGKFSTASLAKLLSLPVVLVVDAYGMAESAGAIVKGFRDWSLGIGVDINWVIFNRIASERHYLRLKEGVHDAHVLGYVPRNLNFEVPHRHLGLTVAEESPIDKEGLNKLAGTILEHVDLKALIDGCTVKEPAQLNAKVSSNQKSLEMANCCPILKKIAVAYDKAFCFYYEDNLDLLRSSGAEIIAFSPLSDPSLPDGIDAVYIGGGYPELYAQELSGNHSMLQSIHDWSNSGKPLYAECGGLMYLSEGIYDLEDNFFRMAGIFPLVTSIKLNRRAFLGYREITLQKDCILGWKPGKCRGHEFHYSEIREIKETPDLTHIYSVMDNSGERLSDEGFMIKNTLASYIHIHFGSNPWIADSFLNFIRRHSCPK